MIVADTQTVSKVDLTEQIAGKVAVEEAALSLAEEPHTSYDRSRMES
ncbi:MAG: hypothetical protein U0892_19570 [Pirellulales bacterium]